MGDTTTPLGRQRQAGGGTSGTNVPLCISRSRPSSLPSWLSLTPLLRFDLFPRDKTREKKKKW